MPQISYLVRTFVQERLLDNSTGFLYWLGVAAPDYSLPAFTLVQGTNLFLGEFALSDVIEEGSAPVWPVVMVYSKRAANLSEGMTTPSEFSGQVLTVVNFYHGFEDTGPPSDPESLLDLTEDAMVECFNRQQYYGSSPSGTTYNNLMDITYFPLSPVGENWARLQRFVLTHRVLTDGR